MGLDSSLKTGIWLSRMYRSVASLRAQPGYQVEIASACEDATPKDELGGVNHHAEDVEARLED